MTCRSGSLGLLLAALLAAGAPAGQSGAPAGAAKKASDEEINQLITQLGSADFKNRDRATRRLKQVDAALPALRRALSSPDAEVRQRAGQVLAVLEARQAEAFIREAVARVNDEGLDLFIDRMVLEKAYASAPRWKAAVELTRALARRATRVGATVPNVVNQDLLGLPLVTAWDAQGRPARVLAKGSEGTLGAVHGCLVFSSGPLAQLNSTAGSILFVNGDIQGLNSTTDSVIVCNGTIKSFNYTKNCLIFCNGVVESMNCTEGNAVFVRGELRRLNYTKNNVIEATKLGPVGLSEGNTYLNRAALPRAGNGDRFVPADPSPLGLFSYFDPARAGLAFTMHEGDARVDEAAAGKAFARAGLRKGDLVLAVDRAKFLTGDEFVRLLRRRVVAGQALLKVQRGERVLEMNVQFAP
jgi:hypothetical protein